MSIPTDMSFTPDWSKKTDYTEQYPFKSVVFPKNAPLLAEDLNEVQAILNKGINGLGKLILTDGVIPINSEGWLTNVDSKNDFPEVNGSFYLVYNGEIFKYNYDASSAVEIVGDGDYRRIVASILKKPANETSSFKSEDDGVTDLTNYLAENDFERCLSRRDAYSVGIANAWTTAADGPLPNDPNLGRYYCDIAKWDDALGKWVPIYCKLKIDSNQGDTIITDINNFKAETLANIELAFNSFVSKTTIISKRDGSITETDANGNVKNTVFTSDTQIDETLTYNGVTYTKTTVFGTDDSGNEKITETVTVQEGA